jgi:hypothetical protein
MRFQTAALVLGLLATVLGCDFSETTRNAFFPPEDLYEPLGKVQINLSESDSRYSVDVVHKYPSMSRPVLSNAKLRLFRPFGEMLWMIGPSRFYPHSGDR